MWNPSDQLYTIESHESDYTSKSDDLMKLHPGTATRSFSHGAIPPINEENGAISALERRRSTGGHAAVDYNSRQSLSKSVYQKRASLTRFEIVFLERLLIEGSEDDIQSAIAKLSDESMFFSDSDEKKSDSILDDAFINDSTNTSTYSWNNSSQIGSTSKEFHESTNPSLLNGIRSDSDSTRVSGGNVETVIGENGMIEVQTYVKGTSLKENGTSNCPSGNIYDSGGHAHTKSLPGPCRRNQSTASSDARSSAISLRRGSLIHKNLWRAHKSGLAVTPIASNRTLLRTKMLRRVSSSSFNNISLKNVLHTKNLSLSQSEHKLVHQVKLEDKNGSTDNNQTNCPENGDSNINDVFRKGASPNHRLLRRRSSKKLLRTSSRTMRPMMASRNLSITSQTNSVWSNDQNMFPPPLCKANRILSESTVSSSFILNSSISPGCAVRTQSTNSISSFPSIHLANPLCREDSLSSVTSANQHPYTPSDPRASMLSITKANPIRGQSSCSLSFNDYNTPPSHPRSAKTRTKVSPEIAEKWLKASSVTSLHDDLIREPNNESKVLFGTKTDNMKGKTQTQTPIPINPKKVMLRQASVGSYNGMGIEAAEINKGSVVEEMLKLDPLDKAGNYSYLLSSSSIFGSFDETSFPANHRSLFDEDSQTIRPSLSADNLSLFFNDKETSVSIIDDGTYSIREMRGDEEYTSKSWDLDSEDGDEPRSPDAWGVLVDEYSEGYGYKYLPFLILGTSADDDDSNPHVLSPPLMESLQSFLPIAISEQNFWMRYSLLRDGASLETLLKHTRGAQYTILALETTEGEVFGAFTSTPWSKQRGFFGNGEAFLWKMRQSRAIVTNSIIDQAKLESEIDVYLWNGSNYCVQQCTSNIISIGGGGIIEKTPENDEVKLESSVTDNNNKLGLGLAIDKDLLRGTSTSCVTFDNPPLSTDHSDGSPFEIMNLEVWSMTPEVTEEGAIDLECANLFLRSHLA